MGSEKNLTAADLKKKGANDFGSVMRYEPLISATGSSSGSGTGKSGFDRGGYTGYNIRGLESNRVGIEVDGIPQPDATGRSYASRAGLNTFGIGRDYLDPYMYGRVNIISGVTPASSPLTALGGLVSFRPASADDYLKPGKETAFSWQSNYDSVNRSWHNGITAAAGDEQLRGILVYSRRDGQETRNNSDFHAAYPANWHSDALMTSGIWQPNDSHKLTATLDYYSKVNHTSYDAWNNTGDVILGKSQQQSNTRRWSASLKDEWTPFSLLVDSLSTRVFWQQTIAHDNTLSPTEKGRLQRTWSDYDVKTWGADSELLKTVGQHDISAGLNGRVSETARPFRQLPAAQIMQPEANSRSYVLGGYVQDKINFDLDGHAFAIEPGVRVQHQSTKPQNLASLTTGSTVLDVGKVATLYDKSNSDTQVISAIESYHNE